MEERSDDLWGMATGALCRMCRGESNGGNGAGGGATPVTEWVMKELATVAAPRWIAMRQGQNR